MPYSQIHRSTDYYLTQRQFEKITQSMAALAQKLHVSAILLVSSSGRIIAQDVKSGWQGDITLLSTLTASSFAAANEMARILGEPNNFQMVLHEGNHQNIYISAITPGAFLIVIFDKGVALGMVRLFTKRTKANLVQLLESSESSAAEAEPLFNKRFQSLLSDELDQAFKDK